MEHLLQRCTIALALVFMLCLSSGMAAIAEENSMIGDCFPNEPIYTPDMPEYHNKQGQSLYGQSKHDLAIASFQRAVEIDPSYYHAYYGLAFTYRAQGRLDLALENYGEVIRLEPKYAQPYMSRAELYQFMGRYDEAEKDYDSFIKLYGQYPISYLARGDFFMQRRDYFRAAEDYATAIERNPNLQEAYLKYAGALLLSDKPDEASVAFEHSMRIASVK